MENVNIVFLKIQLLASSWVGRVESVFCLWWTGWVRWSGSGRVGSQKMNLWASLVDLSVVACPSRT